MFAFLRKKARRLPDEPPQPVAGPQPGQEELLDALHAVDDPELGVDIVNLGLVREIRVDEQAVHVTMTMTSPACPMGSWLRSQVVAELEQTFPQLGPVVVEVQTDPPWTPEDMSPAARQMLGITS